MKQISPELELAQRILQLTEQILDRDPTKLDDLEIALLEMSGIMQGGIEKYKANYLLLLTDKGQDDFYNLVEEKKRIDRLLGVVTGLKDHYRVYGDDEQFYQTFEDAINAVDDDFDEDREE